MPIPRVVSRDFHYAAILLQGKAVDPLCRLHLQLQSPT